MHIAPEPRIPDDESLARLPGAMNDAFSDYVIPVRVTIDQFEQMMRQRSFCRGASSVVDVDGEIAAFWLMGLRGVRAYLIASGTRPSFRRQGLSKRAADHAIGLARNLGAESILSEVITSNEKALALYLGLGFEVSRTLDCYSCKPTGQTKGGNHRITPVDWRQVRAIASGFRDFRPSWQNDDESIDALGTAVQCLAAYDAGKLAGYVAVLAENRAICQLAVAPASRRRGIGSALLEAALKLAAGEIRLLNIDSDDRGTADFLFSRGATKFAQQLEIRLRLDQGP